MRLTGQIAYDAYCGARYWKSYDGSALPQWPHVKPEIQYAWQIAENAVWEYLRPRDNEALSEGVGE